MISTILIILLILLFIIMGARRGAARTLLNFVGMIAASVISHFLSGVLAQAVYDAFMKGKVISSLESTISSYGAEYAAKTSMDALPAGIRGILRFLSGLLGLSPEALQGRLTLSAQNTEQIAHSLEQPLGEAAVFLLSVIFSTVLFFLLWIVFKMLIRAACRVFELPIIRPINRFFGGVIGALEGAVLACFLANVIYILISCTNPAVADNGTVFGGLFDMLVIFK